MSSYKINTTNSTKQADQQDVPYIQNKRFWRFFVSICIDILYGFKGFIHEVFSYRLEHLFY